MTPQPVFVRPQHNAHILGMHPPDHPPRDPQSLWLAMVVLVSTALGSDFVAGVAFRKAPLLTTVPPYCCMYVFILYAYDSSSVGLAEPLMQGRHFGIFSGGNTPFSF